jgi:prolyl-tRNA synthetase
MRISDLFGQTLRDAPSDAEIPSHKLLVRGAFVRRVASGIWAWLPLGFRVLKNVEQVVREEMDKAGAVELLMSLLQPGELWQKSGRWDAYGPVLYRLKDRSERDFCLAPTHEEMISFLASTELPSYRDLPKIPYHIQWKFRDEPRPRGGLLRGREFYMKDAYSFDADEAGLLRSYETMAAAYRSSFERLGLTAVQIEADPGAIGGTVNHEFTQPCPSGEDTFVSCENGDYAANTEVAAGKPAQSYDFGDAEPEDVATPDAVTVNDAAGILGVEPRQILKALVYRAGDEIVCALVPGDRELNEMKLSRALDTDVRMLDEAGFDEIGLPRGSIGPVGLSIKLIADRSLQGAKNVIGGANRRGFHTSGLNEGRDFTPDVWADLIVAADGDLCDRCGGKLAIERGIEVGHIFQLVGAGYIQKLGVTFTAEDGSQKPFLMGCYGLGISRAVAAIVETHHDERGIAWPRSVAPYQVHVVVLAKDVDVPLPDDALIDDREGVSAGVKFADADLIGCPLQLVVGKTFKESGKLEAKIRATGEKFEIGPTEEAIAAALERCP